MRGTEKLIGLTDGRIVNAGARIMLAIGGRIGCRYLERPQATEAVSSAFSWIAPASGRLKASSTR